MAAPPSAAYRLRKFARRNRGGLAVACWCCSSSSYGRRRRLGGAGSVGAGGGNGPAAGERQAKVAGEVEPIVGEVDRLENEQKWPVALDAARRAEAAAAVGEADPATAGRVHERLRDLEFIDRLERIRIEGATKVDGGFVFAGTVRDYARAFREYGVDVEELPVETSIDRLKCPPSTRNRPGGGTGRLGLRPALDSERMPPAGSGW